MAEGDGTWFDPYPPAAESPSSSSPDQWAELVGASSKQQLCELPVGLVREDYLDSKQGGEVLTR